jgi:hypothetical protein
MVGLKFQLGAGMAAILTVSCSNTVPCPTRLIDVRSEPSTVPILPPTAASQFVSLDDAKRVFAAHDCCDRYINTDISRVGMVRTRGRIYTVFHLKFINPDSEHGSEAVAILDGLQLLGGYEIFDTVIRLKGRRIVFACTPYARKRNPAECDVAAFEDIDLAKSELPKMRLINGQLSYLEKSI